MVFKEKGDEETGETRCFSTLGVTSDRANRTKCAEDREVARWPAEVRSCRSASEETTDHYTDPWPFASVVRKVVRSSTHRLTRARPFSTLIRPAYSVQEIANSLTETCRRTHFGPPPKAANRFPGATGDPSPGTNPAARSRLRESDARRG